MTHVTSVTVSPKNVKIKPGEWYENLNATVLPANADKPCVAWTSSNENVVSVSSFSGAVYGMGLGTAVVYATSIDGTNITDCCTFTVTNNIPITNLALDKTALSMQLNENRTLSATFLPANATNKALTWCSDNTNVVTVNNGTLSAVSTGNAVVTAYTNDGSNLSASCTVKVTTDILVRCITVSDETLSLVVGKSKYITAEVCPTDAKNKNVIWTSSNPSVATVNPTSGLINAISAGSTLITATAADGSGVSGSCQLTVIPYVPVERISIDSTKDVDEGDTFIMSATVFPLNATDNEIVWSSNNTEVAQINSSTGALCALNAGIAHITAKSKNNPSISATCELWVRGKRAVFLIHGRISNSFTTWGAGNSIFTDPLNPDNQDNNHYNSSINALSEGNVRCLYTDKNTQDIFGYSSGLPMVVKENKDSNGETQQNFFVPAIFNGQFKDGEYIEEHPEGGNLAHYLKLNGYTENINLFVFNYPNEDAVVHSAEKFKKYIENLISYVRTSGTDEMKACFYASRNDYIEEKHKINLVGHSMGGLVARYFIENLYQDNHVNKLITICTPHWGSNLANYSTSFGIKHVLCDHDLDPDSEMYGGENTDVLHDGCPLWEITELWADCVNTEYETTNELLYSQSRSTKYYAIAGIDYMTIFLNGNDNEFDMPTNLSTYEQISDFMFRNGVYKVSAVHPQIIERINIKSESDNIVSFLSQIGWTDNSGDTPHKRIQMEKILIIIDANGGNSISNHFHGKMPHILLVLLIRKRP